MRLTCVWAAVGVLACAAASPVPAAELQSGIAVGESVGAYSTTKCGGIDDGVEVGKALCYT